MTSQDSVIDAIKDLSDAALAFQAGVDERLDKFETRLNRSQLGNLLAGTSGQRDKPALKAFEKLMRYGPERLDDDERKAALIIGDDTKGGFLSPPDFVSEMIRNLVQFSPIRQLARIGSTSAGEVLIPKRTATGTAIWVGEVETRSEAQPAYGQERITVNEAAAYIDISLQMLEDAAVDMTGELALGLAEEFGRLEGLAGISGTGLKQPEGVLTNQNIVSVPSGASTAITADSLITMYYALPPFYRNRATWVCSGSTLAAIRKLRDGNGQYLWMPGLAQDRPDTILSRPVFESVDAPDVAANSTPLILGSWTDGYRIYDRLFLSILRDNFSQAQTAKVRFWARRRVGMGVVQSAAFRKMVISAS